MHHAATSCHIGFDVGGTGLKAALVNPTGQILETVGAPTPAEHPPDVMIDLMHQLIQQLLATAQERQLHVAGVGIGLAGLIDAPRGIVITAPNLPAWENVPLVEILSARCGLPVAVDNDVRAMAWVNWHTAPVRDVSICCVSPLARALAARLYLTGRFTGAPASRRVSLAISPWCPKGGAPVAVAIAVVSKPWPVLRAFFLWRGASLSVDSLHVWPVFCSPKGF